MADNQRWRDRPNPDFRPYPNSNSHREYIRSIMPTGCEITR